MPLPTEHSLETRRRQILFRANHRGIREMDILLGRYANAHIPTMRLDDLTRFEQVLELPDQDLLAWMTGAKPVPDCIDGEMLAAISAYQSTSGAA